MKDVQKGVSLGHDYVEKSVYQDGGVNSRYSYPETQLQALKIDSQSLL